MKHIVYLTVNTKNHHIYVGKHKTEDPNVWDGYLGCGVNAWRPWTYNHPKTAFQFAVQKYGPKVFQRVTIAVFDTAKEAYDLEAIIVNKSFIQRKDVYNMTVGGLLPPDLSVEIHQYSLTGEYIKTWPNAQEAAEFFNTNNNVIRGAVNYKTTAKGYLWSEDYCMHLDISDFTVYERPEYVYKFNSDNEIVAKYKTVVEAAEENNVSSHDISHAIHGKSKSRGFYFSYDKDFKIYPSVYAKVTNVYLYNLDGSFFKEFSSPLECSNYFGTNHSSGVYRSLRTGSLYKGYQISKVRHDRMKELEHPSTPKKVAQYDLDGNLIKIWDSTMQARNAIGEGVAKCLKGHQKQTKGFIFKYVK